jgi:predicted transcriptional regulator
MKDKVIKVMDDSDVALVNDLQAIGMSRIAANVLVYLMHNKTGTSQEIEKCTGLRQPEVCKGLQELGYWVKSELQESNRKHRPRKIYSTDCTIRIILDAYFDKLSDNYEYQKGVYERLCQLFDSPKQ